jgi:hypothetical protein
MSVFSHKKSSILASIIGLMTFSFSSTLLVEAKSLPYLIVEDNVVGENAYISGNNFNAGQDLDLNLEKPENNLVKFLVKTDENGQFSTKIPGYNFRQDGVYYVFASDDSGLNLTAKTSFNVYSSEVNLENSVIKLARPLVKADGSDKATLEVLLKDGFGNALAGRVLKIYSDRKADLFDDSLVITDSSGMAKFRFSSTQEGISRISLLDTGDDSMIKADIKVSFVNNLDAVSDIGGDFIQVANAAESGPLFGFEFESLPDNIKPNESISFKLKAVDEEGVKVEDYTGTVRFSVEGDNSSGVSLPPNYKFLAEDLGEHQFSLGMSFAKEGTYKLIVNDLSDKFKKGEKTVIVSAGGAAGSSNSQIKPVITSPTPGTYSQSEQLIAGNAKSSSTIKIYDNNQLIATVPVNPLGKFSYQTNALSDGKHSIYVVNINTVTEEIIGNSETVEINIDVKPPVIEDLQLDPEEEILPGTVIKVKVFSEPGLSEASLLFNFDIIQLNASIEDSSVYVGEIQAPQDPGSYTLGVLLVDELKNEKTYEDQATITVNPNGGNVEKSPEFEDPVQPEITENQIETTTVEGQPTLVSGLIAYGSDKKVTLVWDAAVDDKIIKNYKVYYGESVKEMSKVVLTKDASTTWYIPGLENGKEYFFAVSALDDEGNESESKSEIVSGIPFKLEINNALSESPTKPLVDENLKPAAYSGPFPVNTTKTGPGIMLIIGSTFGCSAYIWLRKSANR